MPEPTGGMSSIEQMIRDLYDKSQQAAIDANQYAVDQGVSDLNAELARQKASYAAQRDQTAIDAANTQNSTALRSALLGDQGGIGQAQYSNVAAARDQSLAYINVAQEQLKADTAKQIADLQAQGKFQEAQIIAQIATEKLQALITESTRLQGLALDEAANAKEEFINTLGAYYGNYQSQISKIQNDGDTSNDWQIAYLQAAEQQKRLDQASAKGGAVSIVSIPTYSYGQMMQMIEESGDPMATFRQLNATQDLGTQYYNDLYTMAENAAGDIDSGPSNAIKINPGANFYDAMIGTALQTYYNEYVRAGETPEALAAFNAAIKRYGYRWDTTAQTAVPLTK
jgi:hypothetical protein